MSRSVGPAITLRADGRYTARITADGKRISIYGGTEAEVVGKWKVLVADQARGRRVAVDKRTTLAQYLATWLLESARPRVRESTLDSYRVNVEHLSADPIGRRRLALLQPDEVQACLARLTKSGLSARSVQYVHAVLKIALNQALRWEVLSRNVAKLVDSPRVTHTEIVPLTAEQAQRLLEAARTDRLAALYTVAIAVGLRIGEALALTWDDVDLEAGLVHVRYQVQRQNGEYKLTEPKSTRSRRTIPLPEVSIASLRAHVAQQEIDRAVAGVTWAERGLVFTNLTGGYLSASWVTHHVQALMELAHLPRIRFHDLRHTCASLLIAQGVHPRAIMEILGHSAISLTMNTYGHVADPVLREAADQMDRALRHQ